MVNIENNTAWQKLNFHTLYEEAGRDTGTTILVHNTGITGILPVSSSICNTATDTGKY
jgi:hypothetical protein